MTVKKLKDFLADFDDDVNVIMQDAKNGLSDIMIQTAEIIAEKDTASSIHTYEKKKIVIIY